MKTTLKQVGNILAKGVAATLVALTPFGTHATSHMDAPLITLDPAANTTDVYAFLSQRDNAKYLTVALAVYPFEEPGIGPNKYNFDDNVLYEIHVATTNKSRSFRGTNDVTAGAPTLSYQFQFRTSYKTTGTILQSYLGVITNVNDAAQNLTQTYTVTLLDQRTRRSRVLGSGIVPPNNQGIATPFYNQGDNGENPARSGATDDASLDRYTAETVFNLTNNYRVFAGQRDDGFYADIQAVFDLLQLRSPGKDAQKGFNVHTIVLDIPVSQLGSDMQVVGVYATTSRKGITVLRDQKIAGTAAKLRATKGSISSGRWIQVGRQGNPLFNEGLVAIVDKDLYNRTAPVNDRVLFSKYAETPELAALLNALVFKSDVAITTGRADLVGIFIPDLIRVDLSTAPARLAGTAEFSRFSIFGNDVLTSQVQTGFFGNGTLPGGWPNGRRFGDDVLDIAVTAVASDLRNPAAPVIPTGAPFGDNVNENDIPYNQVFPYAATPLNGRTHTHH